MRLLLTAFAAIVSPSRRPSIFLRVGNVEDSSNSEAIKSGRSAIHASRQSADTDVKFSESTSIGADLTAAKPLSAVLTHTTADFDSLASAVGLAKVRTCALAPMCIESRRTVKHPSRFKRIDLATKLTYINPSDQLRYGPPKATRTAAWCYRAVHTQMLQNT